MTTIKITKTLNLPESSIIDEMEYNVNSKYLTVRFKTNREYLYYNVPEDVVREMCKAKSVGSFFRENIRDQYETEEV